MVAPMALVSHDGTTDRRLGVRESDGADGSAKDALRAMVTAAWTQERVSDAGS